MIASTPPKPPPPPLLGGGGGGGGGGGELPGAPPPLYEAMVRNCHAHLDKMAEVVATEREQFSFSPWCDLLQESLFQALKSCVCKVYTEDTTFPGV